MPITPEELERLKARVKVAGPDDPIYKSGLRLTMIGTMPTINPIPADAFPGSDPDPEFMDDLTRQVVEERRQRVERKKGDTCDE